MYKIIVNPLAGKGRAARIALEVHRYFTAAGIPFNLEETHQAGEAIQIARLAADQGVETLVAVGGDGTTHELVNGIMNSANAAQCKLAIIPAGSGNDFAAVNRVPTDIEKACQAALAAKERRVDIGQVVIDGMNCRYFANTLGMGLDGVVGMETRKLPWLRGIPLYLLALLKSVFVSLKPFRIEMTVDGVTIKQATLMVAVANGQREGGGFIIAPQASPEDGYLEVIYTRVLSKLKVLGMIPLFLKGTHLGHPAVSNLKARQISVISPDPVYMHIDGEILDHPAHQVEIAVIPRALRLIVG